MIVVGVTCLKEKVRIMYLAHAWAGEVNSYSGALMHRVQLVTRVKVK